MTPIDVATIRNKLGLSQSQLAALLGVHPLTVSKWERGLLRPTEHQELLLENFAIARKTNKEIGDEAKNLLIAAGVIAALVLLLSTAEKNK